MKKILIAVVIIVAVFLIYLGYKDEKIYYVSLGDSLANGINPYNSKDYGYTDYIKDYLNSNQELEIYVDGLISNNKRTIDIINDIKDNKKILVNEKTKTIQNVLIKADLITLSIGTNDILNNLNLNMDFSINDLYSKFEQVIIDYEELFKLLRQYSKEKIFIVGFYNFTNDDYFNEFFMYANSNLKKISSFYDINFIDIYDDFKDNSYFPNSNSKFPNKAGYKIIADKIINNIYD